MPGAAIRAGRIKENLSQVELAERLGVIQSYISQLERGDRMLADPAAIVRIAQAIDLDPDILLAAYGVVPPDITAALKSNVFNIRKVREVLGLEHP